MTIVRCVRSSAVDFVEPSRGVKAMSFRCDQEDFATVVVAILDRFCRQNALKPLDVAEAQRIAARLWQQIETRGLPRPLAVEEMGEPGEMTAEEVAPLVNALLDGVRAPAGIATAARQLVKACFHPEFRKCRDSYRELTGDGACRRQQIDRALARVSGSHCVDCPYWTALTKEQHQTFLRENWRGDATVFAECREVFLPEDFRALRKLVHAKARAAS